MPITLAERIDELNFLIEEVKSKQESLKAAVKKMETLQYAIDFLDKEVEGEEIPVSTTEYGYQGIGGCWVCNELPVSRESFIKFLEEQKEEYRAAAEKLVNELNETMDGNSHKES